MLSNAIFLPHHRVAFGRRFTCYGSNWYEAHEDLAKKEPRMPTLGEFFALFRESLHDPQGNLFSERRQQVYRRKLVRRRPKRHIELLDAFFVRRDGAWYLHQRHIFQGDTLLPLEKIPLDTILPNHNFVTIEQFHPSGFPTKKSDYGKFPLRYSPPQDRHVACFSVDEQGPVLRCDWHPMSTLSLPVVRPAYDLEHKIIPLESRLIPIA